MTAFYTEKLQKEMQRRSQMGLLRQRQVMTDSHLLQFSSNDYLSLAANTQIQNAFQSAFKNESIGSGGSMMVCGYHKAHQDLERAFAEALGVDGCVLFASGYTANLCVAALLQWLEPTVFIDKAIHASVYDGLALANLPIIRFFHNDLVDLTRKISRQAIQTATTTSSVIMTESIFSMSGQLAPLNELNQVAKCHYSTMLVDEAHAFGVMGKEGLGAVVDAGLTQEEVPLRVIPFGKALGAWGAVVAGHGVWIDALLQTRPAVYSTAISPAYARGVLATLEMVRVSEDRRKKLKQLINYFRSAIQQSPLKWRDSHTPIQQLQLGCPHRARALTVSLKKQGILCMAMRQPTVPREETGLRVILNYHHQSEDIDRLLRVVHQS